MEARKIIVLMVVGILFGLGGAAQGTTYYVVVGGNDLADGLSWETAFATINHGIDTASNGDTVKVGEGTFTENVDFDGKAVTLTSTDPDDWDVVEATIIDPNDTSSGSYGVEFSSGEDANSVLTGFTIRRGYYGISCTSSSPAIRNNIIRENTLSGIYCTDSPELDIKNNMIYDNQHGITIDDNSKSGTIRNNTIVYNSSTGIQKIWGGETIKVGWGTDTHVVDAQSKCGKAYSYQSAPIKIPFMMDKVQEEGVDFVVFSGDFNEWEYPCCETTEGNLRLGLDTVDEYNIPRHIVMGNHDFPWANASRYGDPDDVITYPYPNTAKEAWIKIVQEEGPSGIFNVVDTGVQRGYYSFSVKDYHFVILDFNYYANGNDHLGWSTDWNYPEHELDWLEDDLAEHADERTFVFTHFARGSSWSDVKSIFESAGNVEAVFYGHGHVNTYSKTNGIRYYELDDQAECDASSNPNVTPYAVIQIDPNGVFTLTGHGRGEKDSTEENFSYWTETSFQLGCSASITDCILWGNGDDLSGGCSATYSCIEDGDAGTGNISTGPDFVDAANDDYHLNPTSPCIDVGNSTGIGSSETDIDGEPRIMRQKVDMGADEVRRVHNTTQDKWYVYINDAIDEANDFDEIKVHPGTYTENVDFDGKAVTLTSTDPDDWETIEDTIIDADSSGDGVTFNTSEDSDSVITGFTITGADSSGGYGIYCNRTSPSISRCIVTGNKGGIKARRSSAVVNACKVHNNTTLGIQFIGGRPTVKNSLLYENNIGIANAGGSRPTITNNTVVDNTTKGIGSGHLRVVYNSTRGIGKRRGRANPTITNCILWGNTDDLYEGFTATYSCIEDGDAGTGNISGDPNYPDFVDPANDDYHLSPVSPCIGLGNSAGIGSEETGIDGQPRIVRQKVDMGADEVTYGVHNTTQDKWYVYINDAIDEANDFDEIKAYKATYTENVNFDGKAIILTSTDPEDWETIAATIIDADSSGDGVTFNTSEGANSVITGFTITGADSSGDYGIYCDGTSPAISRCIVTGNNRGIYAKNGSVVVDACKVHNNANQGIWFIGRSPTVKNSLIYENSTGIEISRVSSPTITNNTVVDNSTKGIFKGRSRSDPTPTITNCILWDNTDDLYDGFTAMYSCIEDGDAGTGNISINPNFVDSANDDYHLNPISPCIDVGDPDGTYNGQVDIDGEPRVLNGQVDIGVDEVGCVDYDSPFHSEWVDWDAPDCWCYQRNCRGDADGLKIGMYWAQSSDLTIFASAFNKVDDNIPAGGICADFDHKKVGLFRVQSADLDIFTTYFNEAPFNVPECPTDWDGDSDDDYNFWTN